MDSVPIWIEEFKDVSDKRVLWDLIKYRIRQVSMKYSKEKARLRKAKILEIEKSLTLYQESALLIRQQKILSSLIFS